MADELLPAIRRILGLHYSELQERHTRELALLKKLAEQVEKTRLSLIESHSAELDDLRRMHQQVDGLLEKRGS